MSKRQGTRPSICLRVSVVIVYAIYLDLFTGEGLGYCFDQSLIMGVGNCSTPQCAKVLVLVMVGVFYFGSW